ncbi:MAG TPA: hypothetical protein VLH85_02365 [Levilinea sp.]|nr:hypothetical protein [Levilinea sp.]
MPYQREPIDSQLDELLEPLRRTPERNPQVVEAGKASYLAEQGKLGLPEKATLTIPPAAWLPARQSSTWSLSRSAWKKFPG